jgi:hypothetical protein
MMDWKGFGRKRSLPNFKVLYWQSGGAEENHGKPVRIAGLRTDICTRDIPNMTWEC